MTKLVIYRGETQIAEVTLTGRPMKVGRGKDNDIVLEDPGKGVSRVHAELRPEGSAYRLVDLQSQNGIWVSGERVPSVLLAPGVVAAMGPFRVAIDAASPMTQMVRLPAEEKFPDTGTQISQPLPVPLPASPEPVADVVEALAKAQPAEDDQQPATQPPKGTKPTAPPASKPSTAAPAAAAKRPSSGPGRTPLLAVAALVVILACAFAAYRLFLRHPKPQPVWDAVAATALVDNGRCRDAMDQQINRALAADPHDAQALQLKARCDAAALPPTTTTVPPVTVAETNAQKLDRAEAALQAKACQGALDTAQEVLTADANDERAKAVVQKANECLAPPPVQTQASAPADPVARVPPAQGGLDPVQGETGKDYKARVAAVRKRYEDAVALLRAQRYQQAARELDALASQVPSGYLDLAQHRAEVRTAMREESGRAYATAQQAEQRSDWNGAITQYQRAHDLDPARDVTADLARIDDQKNRLGQQLCREAEAAYTLGHNADAASKFTRVLELLPSGDECYVKAKDRLAKIGR